MVHLRMQCAKGSKGELAVRACRRPAMSRTKTGHLDKRSLGAGADAARTGKLDRLAV